MKKETVLFWGAIATLALSSVATYTRIKENKPDAFTPALAGVISLGVVIANF